MEKIGRNSPCPCGSGKKYKKCCIDRGRDNVILLKDRFIEKELNEASSESMHDDEKSLLSGIDRLEKLLNKRTLTTTQKQNAQLNLALAYQRRGEHSKAINILNAIENNKLSKSNKQSRVLIMSTAAASYRTLGYVKESCSMFDEVLEDLDDIKADPKTRAFISLEAGKAFHKNEDSEKARLLWEFALGVFQKDGNEIEHYARALSNLGYLLLEQPDKNEQEKGLKIINEASDIKMRIGDLDGLSGNYCNLGLHYWKNKRYERAIALTRKDLYLSRKIGNLRDIASTLNNLAGLYIELKQLSKARSLLRESKQIAKELDDEYLKALTEHHLKTIEKAGKEAGINKELIGPKAICACGSEKNYQDCCGKADFEPVDIPFQFGGISEELKQIHKDAKGSDIEPSRLDFLFRDSDLSKDRLAWTRTAVHDGWLEMMELPDMANIHLNSARILAQESKEEDFITKPLSCIILSACALEAFINQVAFFLNEIKNFHESKFHTIPVEISDDVFKFQRHTELTEKWNILGKVLCGESWPPPQDLWSDFTKMVGIRNELVHFKVADYEQVVPPPKKPHPIITGLPDSIEIKSAPHSWPIRLLTPSFATWCVKTAESLIIYFKQSYRKSRGFNNTKD